MNVLGIIPARGGSKGIPDKCIALCAGKPLLFYTAREAIKSKLLTHVILSTDSNKIAAVGRALGIEVPFLRPRYLAEDSSPMIGVLQHALKWFDKIDKAFDAVVLLQPTSPLREARHIDESIRLFLSKRADTVVSVTEVPHQFNPESVLQMKDKQLTPYLKKRPLVLRRQDKPTLYARNGPAILVVRSTLIKQGTLYGPKTYGYLMPPEVSCDIDTPQDLLWAQHVLVRGEANC